MKIEEGTVAQMEDLSEAQRQTGQGSAIYHKVHPSVRGRVPVHGDCSALIERVE